MTKQFLTEFIQQLQRSNQHMEFALLKRNQYHSVFLQSYKDADNGARLAGAMEQWFSSEDIIEDIYQHLKSEDSTSTRELAEFASNLNKIFLGYATEGAYSGKYFLRILTALEGFHALAQLNAQRDEELLNQLQEQEAIRGGKADVSNFSSHLAGFYADCKIRYFEKLHEYQHIFHDFLQQETDKRQGLKVTTRTEQCLLKLTSLIDLSIEHSHSIILLMQEWEQKLDAIERQIQFN